MVARSEWGQVVPDGQCLRSPVRPSRAGSVTQRLHIRARIIVDAALGRRTERRELVVTGAKVARMRSSGQITGTSGYTVIHEY